MAKENALLDTTGKDSAKNVANYEKYKAELKAQDAVSVATKTPTLTIVTATSKFENVLKGTEISFDKVLHSGTNGGNFFEGAKYTDKVLSQMRNGDMHGFPESVEGYALKYGQTSTRIGGDGKTYEWLELKGEYKGKS